MHYNIQNIPDMISLTELRYKTSLLIDKLTKEQKPVLLLKRNKQIGIIYTIIENLGKKDQKID